MLPLIGRLLGIQMEGLGYEVANGSSNGTVPGWPEQLTKKMVYTDTSIRLLIIHTPERASIVDKFVSVLSPDRLRCIVTEVQKAQTVSP